MPTLAAPDRLVVDRLKGSGRHLPPDEREARTQRVIEAGKKFAQDPASLHPLAPEWDQAFMTMIADFDERGTQWLRTGDIGKTDEDGYVYIVDRKKDMILSGGQNIYPADIEAIAIEHPAISEVSVIGISHEKWGETPLALVVPTAESSNIDTDALKTWINERVGKRQRVHAVALVDNLPRNPNGKVLKRNLRERFRDYGD